MAPAFQTFQCQVCGKVLYGTEFQARKSGWKTNGVIEMGFGDFMEGDLCGECIQSEWKEEHPLNYHPRNPQV